MACEAGTGNFIIQRDVMYLLQSVFVFVVKKLEANLSEALFEEFGELGNILTSIGME